MRSSDAWQKIGEDDPFFGVLSAEKYRIDNMSDAVLEEFYASGLTDLEPVLRRARTFGSALDFGCGVGRIAIPLSERFETVVGVDVSPGMLALMEKRKPGLKGVTSLDEAGGPFDLVHSYIVLQHIEVGEGYALIERLASLVAPGGLLAIHVTFHRDVSIARRMTIGAQQHLAPVRWSVNVLKRRAWNTAFIQMNDYDIGKVLRILTDAGFPTVELELTDHSGHVGARLYSTRPIGS